MIPIKTGGEGAMRAVRGGVSDLAGGGISIVECGADEWAYYTSIFANGPVVLVDHGIGILQYIPAVGVLHVIGPNCRVQTANGTRTVFTWAVFKNS